MATDAPERPGHARRVARNTAFFSFATGLSRLLGLAREVVAAKYFGVTAAMSASPLLRPDTIAEATGFADTSIGLPTFPTEPGSAL